ncbi:MAG: DUF3883 domain-containing protein [Oscillospiraceae bacterium]|jgi:hypothetical protein|nr:DUF3883 domain-containing protein [Oscillospiraceae bacterium]
MYDHTNQYRCDIIRGKSQSDMDDLLPAYAKIIDEICPCSSDIFKSSFNTKIKEFLTGTPKEKTLNNHRTEIAGKLFGMYYSESDGLIYASDRTKKFIADSDTPAFFKDICYKMQFPNGTQKIQTIKQRIDDGISIRQNSFVLKVMLIAKNVSITLTKKEIAYYILNSYDVLSGNASPYEVFEAITKDRQDNTIREITIPGKESSYCYQHTNEQINLLELANLVRIDGAEVILNLGEQKAIEIIAKDYKSKPAFDLWDFDLSTVEGHKKLSFEWNKYFAVLSDEAVNFGTTIEALGIEEEKSSAEESTQPTSDTGTLTTVEIGDEGERYVYEYEKKRVTEFNFRLAGKVLHLGKTRGLGYDIQSVVAKPGPNPDFVKYIEVKATKRVTAPKFDDTKWIDTLNITRNEWVAAQQHKESYSIFRVYFIRGQVVMFVISDIAGKNNNGVVTVEALNYRMDFGNKAVDEVITVAV